VGEEWRTKAEYKRNWRESIEDVVRERWGKRRGRKNTTETTANLTPDDRYAKRRTTTLCNL